LFWLNSQEIFKKDFDIVIKNMPEILEYILDNGIDAAMNKYNGVLI